MNYTNSITSKGQIVVSATKSLQAVRELLGKPTFEDAPSDKELAVGRQLAKQYGIR